MILSNISQGHGAMPASTGIDAAARIYGVDDSRDVYEVWQAIFDRARVTQLPRDEASPNPSRGGALPWHQEETAATSLRISTTDDIAASSVTRAILPSIESIASPFAVLSAIATHAREVEASAMLLLPPERGRLEATVTSGETLADGLAGSDSRAEPSTFQPNPASDQVPVLAADSINVFMHADAVSIVVRDVTISDEQALSCAFEAASELTGQRSSLSSLMLNGRVLYRHSGIQPSTDGTPALLVFAC